MSRVRSRLTTVALISGAIALSTLTPDLALAQCSTADQCSQRECQQRHQLVDQYCKHQKRSCTKVSARNKPKLQRYLARNEQCLGAREYVAECFSVTNAGHQDAIDATERAITTCENKINQK